MKREPKKLGGFVRSISMRNNKPKTNYVLPTSLREDVKTSQTQD